MTRFNWHNESISLIHSEGNKWCSNSNKRYTIYTESRDDNTWTLNEKSAGGSFRWNQGSVWFHLIHFEFQVEIDSNSNETYFVNCSTKKKVSGQRRERRRILLIIDGHNQFVSMTIPSMLSRCNYVNYANYNNIYNKIRE